MLNVIKNLLQKVIKDIELGNSNITETEATEVINLIKKYTDPKQKLSKYSACLYLNVSRATFDKYVKEGKLPKGIKESGFKELSWYKKDLDEFIKKNK